MVAGFSSNGSNDDFALLRYNPDGSLDTGFGALKALFSEGSPPVAVDTALTLSDVDNSTLASATVSITSNFQPGQDVLAFGNDGSMMDNIVGSYDAGTGVLTLTSSGATATLAQWQAALQAITYTNTSDAPNTAERTLSLVVNDGLTTSAAVTKTLTVTATNDAPVISSNGGGATATVNVAENTTAVTTVVATDADADAVTYAITGGADQAAFTINATTGVLRFASVPNFEAPTDVGDTAGNNTYVFEVTASDGQGGTDVQTLTVSVTDVAEGGGGEPPPPPPPPQDDDEDGIAGEQEDDVPGIPSQPGGPVVAGDGNGDGIKDSEQPQVTSLNFRETTRISNDPTAPTTPVTLVAGSQDGKLGPNAGNAKITSIGQQDTPADLPEELIAPLGLLSFSALVGTPGDTQSFSFFLDERLGINGYFKQNSSGAWVNLADPANGGRVVNENGKTRLDFVIEDGGQFDSDGTPDGTITDPGAPGYLPLPPAPGNSAPVITSGSTASVAENAPTSTVIYQASATDADTGQSLTYSLSGADAALLNIDASTGAVTLKASADYEAQASYRFSVTATDNAAAPLSATQAVTVSVTDVNEAPSAVALSRSSTSLAENTSIASRREVASLNITDDALGSNAVTLSGKDAASFEVSAGKLYLKAGTVLDFETQSRYDVTVSVADSTVAGSSPVRADFTLRVTDVNEDNPPQPVNTDSDNDQFPDALEASHGLSVGTKDNDVFASTKFYAMQLYRDTLFREAEGEGLAYWQQVLDSGAQSRVQVAQAFLDSPEFQTHAGALARLYFAAFDRIPDEAGMSHWMEQMLNQGQSLEQVAQGFANSSEFQQQYGPLDNAGFLDTLYQNVLGRSPDEAGKAYWLEQMDAGTTRGEVLAGFAQSGEYQSSMHEEVSVTLLYVGLLGRTPEPGGYAHWLGAIDASQGDALGAIEVFLQSQEYHDRFLPGEEVGTAALVGLAPTPTAALLSDGIG